MNEHSWRELVGEERRVGFDQVAIGVASSDTMRSWSKGEVKNPETINYRTFKPEKGGLFCERIFGPTRDWECSCGKYKRIKHKGVICDRCGVEVTLARVRRERMGHIELAVPVSHIWFYKCMPSRIGLMLDMSARQLERVIYYEDYIVIDPGKTPLQKAQLLNEVEYREAQEQYGDDFVAGMGAEAIKKLLAEIDLNKLNKELEKAMGATKSKQIRKKLAKRLKLVQGFQNSHARPEWMILDVLPVIPPDLRPLVPLEGGRFATSDLNDLYRRVINRNNRLKNLLLLKTPDVIIRNEKRMLQEAVDALFDNGRHGRAVTGAGNRPLKSLSDMLKGKGGRFRQNLLGKRVDYSGRSVIVIGPELKLHQCGLPKKMALVLFEPFMVLLNRAPTLHRLSIQAFEPQLIEGEAIRIHPLVCTAYNADFDGDQMAVHVPLSVEAQMEARMLMLAPNNIFSPSSGKPITTPSQDITLGCYYLTQNPRGVGKDGQRLSLFSDAAEVEFAMAERSIRTHDRIRIKNPDFGQQTIYGNAEAKTIETTAGRVVFNEIWPEQLGFFNKPAGKKQLSDIIWRCYQIAGPAETVATLDKLKELGFSEATKAGISIGISDMIIPKEKQTELENAYKQIRQVEQQYRKGIITDGERYNKIVDIWTHAGDEISSVMFRTLEHNEGRKELNPVYLMVDSGSRGNRQQVRQLAGMRGLMAKPSGEIIERPITSNFREGLSVLEYFISTHGARKGLADTALKTADSGYLTRKLVDAAQDVIINEEDCGTVNGIVVRSIYEGDEEVVDLGQRIIGRVSCETIADPVDKKKKIVKANQLIDEKIAAELQRVGVESLKIRSVLTCECGRGVCGMCYGRNLATGQFVKLGEAVGIIAAQSIGEPGTQLTMRTFHIGGTASQTFKQPIIKAKNDGAVRFNDLRTVQALDGSWIVLNKNGSISVHNTEGRELERYNVVIGSMISKDDGATVKKGETFVQWDPYNVPILTDKGGKVEFRDMIAGVTIKRDVDEATGLMGTVIIEHKEDLHPQVVIVDDKKEVLASYSIPAGAHVIVEEGQKVRGGALLAKTPRKVAKTKDITGGLPRVAELFEARRPKDAAEIAKIDGIVEMGGTVRGKRRLILKDSETGTEEEHLIPLTKHIIVFKGDFVKKGQQLTEGPVVPHEILEVCGPQDLQEHLVNEVQEVYRLQGVEINDKHIEIIVRQMLRKVKITDPGDTSLLWGDQVDRIDFEAENQRVVEQGGKPAEATPVLLGITKASLETDSFISAASFQDTTRVLTEAATLGKVDKLRGFKENVIMGHLIPAGTGFPQHREIRLVEKGEPIGAPVMEEAEPQPAVG